MKIQCWFDGKYNRRRTIDVCEPQYDPARVAVYDFMSKHWDDWDGGCGEILVWTKDEAGRERSFTVETRIEFEVFEEQN